MKLFLVAYRVVDEKKGSLKQIYLNKDTHIKRKVVIAKLDSEDLNFNINDHKQWVIFLRNFRLPNGQPLPKLSKGKKVAYKVYKFGGYPLYYRYFPGGYKKGADMSQKKFLAQYGLIYNYEDEK